MNIETNAQKRKILLIDDSSNNIELLFDMLSDEYEIFFATNGPKGIELANSKLPDLILLDIVMPVVDGFAVCQQLKAKSSPQRFPAACSKTYKCRMVSAEVISEEHWCRLQQLMGRLWLI